MIPARVVVEIAGLRRELVVREVAPGVHLGILLLACDPELTEAAGRALAARLPADADVLVMPDGKALALLHVVQRESGLPAVLVRKRRASYLVEPVLEVVAQSATTTEPHSFYLGADGVALLRGRKPVFLDDVISTHGTASALGQMCQTCEAREPYFMCVATEGVPRPDLISLVHLPVFRSVSASSRELSP